MKTSEHALHVALNEYFPTAQKIIETVDSPHHAGREMLRVVVTDHGDSRYIMTWADSPASTIRRLVGKAHQQHVEALGGDSGPAYWHGVPEHIREMQQRVDNDYKNVGKMTLGEWVDTDEDR